MKKLFNFKNIILFGVGLLGIVTFVLSFLVVVNFEGSISSVETTTEFKNVIWGSNEQIVTTSLGSLKNTATTDTEYAALTLSLVGYILTVVAAVLAIAIPFIFTVVLKGKEKLFETFSTFVVAALFVVGAIFIFGTMKEFVKVYEINENLVENYSVNALVIISGILACVCAALTIMTRFVKVKIVKSKKSKAKK